MLQIEHHPYLSQEPLVAVARAFDIKITAYSSFGPQSFVELGMDKGVDSLLKNKTINEIAERNKKSPSLALPIRARVASHQPHLFCFQALLRSSSDGQLSARSRSSRRATTREGSPRTSTTPASICRRRT